jgi:hypothetical protein
LKVCPGLRLLSLGCSVSIVQYVLSSGCFVGVRFSSFDKILLFWAKLSSHVDDLFWARHSTMDRW